MYANSYSSTAKIQWKNGTPPLRPLPKHHKIQWDPVEWEVLTTEGSPTSWETKGNQPGAVFHWLTLICIVMQNQSLLDFCLPQVG